MYLPVISFAGFRSGEDKTGVAAAIDRACREHGFFYLSDHGLDPHIINACFDAAADFFSRPASEKEKIAISRSSCHRGWYRLNEEVLDPKGAPKGDYKEGLKIGFDCPADHPRMQAGLPLHGPNQWPDIAGWREIMTESYDACSALAREIMHAMALGLNLEEAYFDKWLHAPMATLSPIYYPPHKGAFEIGAGAHTDFGCLTLLIQRDIGGLEIYTKAGDWQPAPPVEGAIIVNIGDMMARWTNDEYASTLHRVVNKSNEPRQSLAFFFDPDPEADLTALPQCMGDGNAHYPPTTALQHLLEKIDDSFSYRHR